MNNETEKVKITGLQKSLPSSNSGVLITYPLSFVVVFFSPNRRLMGDYLEIHKEAPLRFFFRMFYSILLR